MENVFISLILILIGGINLYFAIRFLKNPKFGKDYIKNSPKAYLWRKLFGEEKAYSITRKVFVPIGIILGVIFILIGLSLLFVNFTSNLTGNIINENNEEVIYLDANDTDVIQAKEQAQSKMDYFILSLDNQDYACGIKTFFDDENKKEHMWIIVNNYSNGKFYGILVNDPEVVTNYVKGDEIVVAKENVEDWVIFDKDENIIEGNFLAKIIENK